MALFRKKVVCWLEVNINDKGLVLSPQWQQHLQGLTHILSGQSWSFASLMLKMVNHP